jgi:serine/threonine protein kinase/tetratricopeptide (TPR) repeat protein
MTQLHTGEVFANRFEIDRLAGSGGMGTVYRALDRYSGDVVALKLLHRDPGGRSDEGDRFVREAQLLSELRHPGIVSYVVHGMTPQGQPFLAMQWLDGYDLGHRLSRGVLPLRDALLLIQRVAEALSLAHQRGVVHRDLKPSNLFLPEGGIDRVKLLDFGIARRQAPSKVMTRTGMVLGTPEYMAPEQARGVRELTPAADIFSLGCVLYECLTGEPPFVAEHIAAVLVRILFEQPVPLSARRPGMPQAIEALLDDMLSKEPTQRIADAAALLARLAALGEVPELPLLPTLSVPANPSSTFAQDEQALFSLVIAAGPQQDGPLSSTLPVADAKSDAAHHAAVASAVRMLGARAEYLIDGALVVTVPQAGSAQDQVAMAARVALLIKEHWPEANVAVTTGRGSAQAAAGELADRAVKLLQRRTGEQPAASADSVSGVWLDELSARLLGPRFAVTQTAEGMLLTSEEKEVHDSRPLLGKPTPCVGRDAELGNLEGLLNSCIEESEARVVLVTSPPGIGKSRLRHEFLRRVTKRSDRLTVLHGQGDMMSAGAPYGILSSAIRGLCDLMGGEAPNEQRQHLRARIAPHAAAKEQEQERVVEFIGELCHIPFPEAGKPMLQAARQEPKIMRDCLRRALLDWLADECAASPVLLVLDDLQWGDELTVSVIDEALRELAGAPLFVLAFARPEVYKTFPRLWHEHKFQEIALKGLSRKACERLIQQVLGKNVPEETVARVVEQSAGNALYLEELIRSLAEGKSAEQPETVLAMLQARIGRLDSGARRVVRAAAVFGQNFWQGGVAALLGVPKGSAEIEEGLKSATHAELLQPHASSRFANEKEYGFRHALVREAAYSLLTASDLAIGHRLAAEFLESLGDSDAAAVAEHFERCGENTRAASGYLRAAEDHLKRGNNLGALRHVERGILCEPSGELLGQLRSVECQIAFLVEQFERIGKASTVALNLLRAGSLAWCRAMGPTVMMMMMNRPDKTRGMELLSVLLEVEPDADALPTYVEALSLVHSFLTPAAPAPLLQKIQRRLGQSVAQIEVTNPAGRRYLHSSLGRISVYRAPRPWTAVTEYERAIKLCEQAGDARMTLTLRSTAIEHCWLDLGDLAGARQRMLALTTPMEQNQDKKVVSGWRHLLARILCESQDEADWDQAEALILPVLSQTGGNPLSPLIAQGIMGRLALLRGRLQDAAEQSNVMAQLCSIQPAMAANFAAVRIRALLGLGATADAVVVAEQLLDAILSFGGLGVAEVEARLAASEAFHAAGNLDRARAELRETLRQIHLRADDITDPFWKNSYLTRNRYCVRAQQLGQAWEFIYPGHPMHIEEPPAAWRCQD